MRPAWFQCEFHVREVLFSLAHYLGRSYAKPEFQSIDSHRMHFAWDLR